MKPAIPGEHQNDNFMKKNPETGFNFNGFSWIWVEFIPYFDIRLDYQTGVASIRRKSAYGKKLPGKNYPIFILIEHYVGAFVSGGSVTKTRRPSQDEKTSKRTAVRILFQNSFFEVKALRHIW